MISLYVIYAEILFEKQKENNINANDPVFLEIDKIFENILTAN